jgi:hypothetical protein
LNTRLFQSQEKRYMVKREPLTRVRPLSWQLPAIQRHYHKRLQNVKTVQFCSRDSVIMKNFGFPFRIWS